MTKIYKIISFCLAACFFTSCSQVLQTVNLNINSEDSSLQEEFNVVEKTLTIKEAKAQKGAPYSRAVLKNGRGQNSQPISEKLALKSEFPKNNSPMEYKIGIGDQITFSRLIENNRSDNEIASQWPQVLSKSNYKLGIGDSLKLTLIKQIKSEPQTVPNEKGGFIITTQPSVEKTINSTGRIGSDGSVLLLEVGRLEASGKTLNELRSEVRNILIRKSGSKAN